MARAPFTTDFLKRTIIDDALPVGLLVRAIIGEAPFDRCDRVQDYRVAWAFFEGEGG